MWDVLGHIFLLVFGPTMAWTGGEWRHAPERVSVPTARGRRWVVRWWAAGYVLVGIGAGVAGVYGLVGVPEPWVVSFCRSVALLLFLLVHWSVPTHRSRGRWPTESGATDGM